ncbi:hypothetical protein EB796_001991 [Bugula neritina]|uniref:DUF4795 domain-containing protein n=1 Tax=Bugula neritina TaxID=10212 RepID=A0A7J7KNG2_BUGNE|nr:hypothetical protein EB796_001991 [Bugula neritina]
MSELTNKLNDVDSHKQQLLDLQRRLDALPLAEEIVTWPGLEDALKGVKGEFAAYRPESRARLNVDQNELRPDTAASGSSIDNSLGSKKSHPASRPRSTSSDGPSIGLVDVLEKLGTVDTRHEELKKRVEDLEQQMKNKANKEDISLDLPEDLLEQINDMQNRLTQLDELRAKDADAVKKLQNAMFGLRDDLTNMQNSIDAINFENKEREKALEQLAEKASKLEKEKADKESMEAELDTKADKSQVDGKLNRSLFDSTVADLQKMIDDLLSKLHAYEDAWKQAHSKVEEDVDGKIDRTELDRLKAYIDRKLRDLNTKIKNNSEVFNPFCEDAAGLKRQLLPFNCLSCDKPVVINSGRFFSARTPLSHNNAFGPLGDAFSANKSSRPYTTFELDQIRQHAKSLLNADYVMDYYSTPRTAGGSHTMTYPYKRSTKHGYNRELFNNPTDEIPSDVFMPVRDETEIVGADGHVYRGRFDVTSGDPNPTPSLEVPAAPPSRPKSSPARRSGNNRPGNMTRPKTAQLQVKVESSALPVKKSDSNEGGLADVPTAFDVEHTSLPEQRAKE